MKYSIGDLIKIKTVNERIMTIKIVDIDFGEEKYIVKHIYPEGQKITDYVDIKKFEFFINKINVEEIIYAKRNN